MHSLPLFVRLTGRTVILVGDGEAAAAKRRLLERAGAVVSADPTAHAALAIVALEGESSDAEAAHVAALLKARGLLVNVVDRPALCDFTLPAIVDRDPVLVAIGTGGASAGLAKALRQHLETLLPADMGALANALHAARDRLRATFADGRDRRRAVDTAIAAADPWSPGAADRLAFAAGTGTAAPRLETIHLTSPDPEDLTLRAARLLGAADALWHDGTVPEAILSRARADAERHVSAAAPTALAEGLTIWLTH